MSDIRGTDVSAVSYNLINGTVSASNLTGGRPYDPSNLPPRPAAASSPAPAPAPAPAPDPDPGGGGGGGGGNEQNQLQ